LWLRGFADASIGFWREHGYRHGRSFLWKVKCGSNQVRNAVLMGLDQRLRLAVTNIVEILEIGPERCVRRAHSVCKNHVKLGWCAQNLWKMQGNPIARRQRSAERFIQLSSRRPRLMGNFWIY
jgi:hypothetical protein